jgi:GTPase
MQNNENNIEIHNERIPTVAIIGRPNVGKSALFNAIIGKRISIVHAESGVTRDNVIAPKKWGNHYFQLIDTGGLGGGNIVPGKNISFFDSKICSQVEVAVESADLLLFVVDVTAGVTPLDEEVAKTLRKCKKKTILIVNKVDNDKLEDNAPEFMSLGISDIETVSCLHRRGISDMIDNFTKLFWEADYVEKEERLPICVVGRPNVGKSSIVNRLVGKDRLIVSDIAGTTRDAVEIPFDLNLQDDTLKANFIDTAGLRKKGKADTAVEVYSIIRAEEAIKKSDIVIFVTEAREEGPTAQDAHIGKLIGDNGKGCIIVANKWDKCAGLKQKDVKVAIQRKFPFLSYAPIVFSCALSGYNFKTISDEIALINEQYKVQIPTSTVNKVLSDAITFNPPPCVRGAFFRVYYATMVHNKPPIFKIFVNNPKLCPANYESYLRNYLRKSFNLHGLPIRIKLTPRKKIFSD